MYGKPHVADTTNAMRCEYLRFAHIYTVVTVLTETDVKERIGASWQKRSVGRPSRPRRRDDPSPDGGDGSDDDGSSEDDDRVEARAAPKRLHIKLQKFDSTGSWESWWAHFQNCASYNK